jgi:hypothetical protein
VSRFTARRREQEAETIEQLVAGLPSLAEVLEEVDRPRACRPRRAPQRAWQALADALDDQNARGPPRPGRANGREEILSTRMDDHGNGAGLFLKIAGLCLACGVVALIALMIFWRAVYAFGIFGAFLVGVVVILLFGWIYDRRNARTQV